MSTIGGRKPDPARAETYARMVDKLRGGLNVKQAATVVAADMNTTESAVRQRYQREALERRTAGETTPPTRAPRRRPEAPPEAPATIPPVDVVALIETAAAMIREAAKAIADIERDAEKYRRVRDALGDAL